MDNLGSLLLDDDLCLPFLCSVRFCKFLGRSTVFLLMVVGLGIGLWWAVLA